VSYQGQDPNQQGQYPQSGQYSSGYTPPQQPADPYSDQQYGQGEYGQQQYGHQQPYGYQQPYGMPPSANTSLGLSQNVASGLSYVLGWITGIIIFLVEKQNRLVRFHAMQSILFFGGLGILEVILDVITNGNIFLLSGLAGVLSPLVFLVGFIGWIILMINGFQGKYFKLPIVGDYAERYANQINL